MNVNVVLVCRAVLLISSFSLIIAILIGIYNARKN